MGWATTGTLVAWLALLAGCGDLGDEPMDWSTVARAGTPTPSDPGQSGVLAAEITIENLAFTPDYLLLASGGTVTWHNRDLVPHTANSGTPENSTHVFDSPLLNRGDSWSFMFTVPGRYLYYCSTHANVMRDAVIEVVDSGSAGGGNDG